MRDIEAHEERFLAVSLKTAMIVTIMTNTSAFGYVSVSRLMFGKLRGFTAMAVIFRTDSFRKGPSLVWLKTLLFLDVNMSGWMGCRLS